MCSSVVFYINSLHSNQVSVGAACNTRWPLLMGSDVSRDVNANTLHMYKVHFATKRREHRHEEFWNIGRQRFGYSGGIICGFPVTHDSAAWRSYRTSDVPSRCPTVCFLKTWTNHFPRRLLRETHYPATFQITTRLQKYCQSTSCFLWIFQEFVCHITITTYKGVKAR